MVQTGMRQPSANLACIISRRQLVKTSAQCTILLRYCQCRGPELASATLPLAPQLRKSGLRPGEVRFSEEPAWFCCACRSDRSAWPWLTCSTACSDSVVQAGGPYSWYLPFRAKPGSVPCPYPASRGTEALFQTGYSLTWIRKRARGNRARLTPSRPVGSCCRNRLNSPRIGIFRRHHFDFYRK